MEYDNENFRELEELSHSDNPEIGEKAGNWLIAVGLQDVAGLRVSPFLLDLAVRNVKGELSSEDVSRLLDEHYPHDHRATNHSHPMDDDYEIIPEDDPRIRQIEAFNRELRPELYARLDAESANNKNTNTTF